MQDSPGKRLALFRSENRLTQRSLAGQLGVSNALVAQIENDSRPPSRGFLQKISDAYGVSSDWLLHGMGEMLRPPTQGFKSRKIQIDPTDPNRPNHGELSVGGWDYAWIKRMGLSVSAGSGISEVPETESEGVFFPMHWFVMRGLNPDLCVMVSVRGDSMAPAIPDGSMVIIDCMDKVLRHPGIYAFTLDGQVFVKRIVPSGKDKLGRPSTLMILSDNPAYGPIALTGAEMNELRVAGKVVATFNLLKA